MTTSAGTTPLAPETRPRLREGVRLQRDRLSGQLVLLFPEGILFLNDTAASALTLCDGQRNVREIVATLTATYEVSHDLLFADIREYFLNLWNRELIHLPSEDAP